MIRAMWATGPGDLGLNVWVQDDDGVWRTPAHARGAMRSVLMKVADIPEPGQDLAGGETGALVLVVKALEKLAAQVVSEHDADATERAERPCDAEHARLVEHARQAMDVLDAPPVMAALAAINLIQAGTDE